MSSIGGVRINNATSQYTAITIKVVHEQSVKVEYERERQLGIAFKLINLLAIPSSLSRSYSTFPLCSWTTLIDIAVCKQNANLDFNALLFTTSL
jgi:hypothetical protein